MPAADAPSVSIIIPAYNASAYIADALNSALAQKFTNYEIVVINDGSPDTAHLENVLAPFMDRIVYLRQENQGLAGARNAGIRAARGKYIAPLDADDTWNPDFLAAQIAVLEADPTIDVLYADARIFGQVPEAGRTVMELCPSAGEVTFESLVTRRCTVHICVTVCRREALGREGLFDATLRRCEDIDMWLRITAGGGRIAYQRRVLGNYRRRPDSLSADTARLLEAFLTVLAKAARDPRLTAAQRQTISRQCCVERAAMELAKGKNAILEGDDQAAAGHLARANIQRKSLKLSVALMLLRFAPGVLRTFYLWRHRRVYRLKTQP